MFTGPARAIVLGCPAVRLGSAPVMLGLGSLGGCGGPVLVGSFLVGGCVADAVADRLLVIRGGHVVDASGQVVVFGRVPVGRGDRFSSSAQRGFLM